MIPWPATRVAHDDQLRSAGMLERGDRRLARIERVVSHQVQCVGESGQHRLVHLDMAREHDQRLARLEEVVDPGDRGGELPAGGQALQRPELRQALGPQRRRDPCLELGQIQWLRAQPLDHVALGQPVLGLVGQRDRHDDLALLGQLRQHVGLHAAHEATPAQVPVQALLAERAAELLRERRAGAEILEAPDHA